MTSRSDDIKPLRTRANRWAPRPHNIPQWANWSLARSGHSRQWGVPWPWLTPELDRGAGAPAQLITAVATFSQHALHEPIQNYCTAKLASSVPYSRQQNFRRHPRFESIHGVPLLVVTQLFSVHQWLGSLRELNLTSVHRLPQGWHCGRFGRYARPVAARLAVRTRQPT